MVCWDELDTDAQIQVLKSLPVKTLIRLIRTSRSMFSLITSPTFMISLNPRKTLYHIYSGNLNHEGHQTFWLWKDSEEEPMKTGKITCRALDVNYSLVGSCDGLLCFNNVFRPDRQKLVFWNPFLGKFIKLSTDPKPAERSYALGLGFDRSKIDYKVVIFGISPDSNSICADIFMLFGGGSSKAYGSISGPAPGIMGRGVYINGVIHWVLERKERSDANYSILTFHLATEVFAEMTVPDGIGRRSIVLTTLTLSHEEKLAVYHNGRICNVWVMEEYGSPESWRKLCTIDVGSEYSTILNARENGEIFVSTNEGRLLRYNPNTETLINIRLDHALPLDYVGPCIESLVFPSRHHGPACGKRFLLEAEQGSTEKGSRFMFENV